MKVTIDSVIRLQDVPENILKQIKAELTIKNQQYDLMKRIKPRQHWMWGEQYIKLYSELSNELILPRGYFARAWNMLRLNWSMIEDRRVKLPEVEYPKHPQLRDYQEPAPDLAKNWQQGVVIAPCGTGKTEMGMGIIANIGQPALWIAHTLDLVNQSMDRAKLRLGLSGRQIGLIQGENMSIGTHITFATVQTLAKRDLSRVRDLFGCIIVDECHLVVKDGKKFRMFADVIAQLPAFYRFGLTASEHRSDGLISTMFHVVGPKFYEVAQDDPRLTVMKPRVEFIETDFEYDQDTDEDGEKEMLSVQQMYRAMREDVFRNIIIGDILAFKINKSDCCLCLGDSLEHLEEVALNAGICNLNAAFICGETTKQKREQIITDMRAGKYQMLCATYALAKLGLDISRLDKLILLTPHKDKTTIQQAVGRIMRPFEGKQQPVVYDIWDNKVKACQKWARERVRVYREIGAEINGGPKIRK